MEGSAGAEDRSLVEESRHIWDQNAEVWDSVMAAGRGWQKVFIGPVVERLLELRPGDTALDIACGNGIFSRRMAELGAYVVACDFSPRLVELARSRTTEHADRIEYHVADATDEAQLVAMGEGRFDAAVCSMALMDMPAIEPLYRAVSRMLKPGGRFVLSVSHPCFNTGYTNRLAEEDNSTGEVTHSIKVSSYLSVRTSMGVALRDQPAKQYYWDRPISVLLGAAFAAGLVLDALEEPPFKRDTPAADRLDWANFDMPPVLFARLWLPR
ncbi:MAG TPA: class I SAM-dependent methyltransferase [Chloroflexia bacterium]|jgi:SAM-dependent methyltransferase